MFKWLLAILLALFSVTSYGKQKDEIAYVFEENPSYLQSKKVFVDAFVHCYNQIPLEVLKQPSRETMTEWLKNSFEETYKDFKSSTNKLWLSAKAEGSVVGFLVIDTSKYPEEIYLAQLAVDPAYQRQGIASTMIRSLFDQFSECRRFVVIPRCANEEAKNLYKSLGFSPSSYMHEGYSAELYTGFEYSN